MDSPPVPDLAAPPARAPGNTPPAAGVAALVERLVTGDPRALARAISLVENAAPEAPALLSACFPHTSRNTGSNTSHPAGCALRIGITGSPGAGKSTLVDRLARHWLTAGKSVGVLAVDPTSPFTGGAILGDRIRLQDHHGDPNFYARSMATRGALGGLAAAAADAALLIEASGKCVVLIETVGVGQDEIEIARLADITLVVLVPGMGDDVQSLKAGVMEIADLYVINKSDRDGADRVEQEIRALQSLAPPSGFSGSRSGSHDWKGHGFSHAENAQKEGGALAPEANWTPPVLRTVATTGDGIARLAASIQEMEQWLRRDDRLSARRALHWQRRLEAMLRAELMRRARSHGLTETELARHAAGIASGQQDPWTLVPQLAAQLWNDKEP